MVIEPITLIRKKQMPLVWDKKIIVAAIVITLLAAYQMREIAEVTGNWKGFAFSMLHIAIVVAGALYAIGKREVEADVDQKKAGQ